jgi:hypothetical protein
VGGGSFDTLRMPPPAPFGSLTVYPSTTPLDTVGGAYVCLPRHIVMATGARLIKMRRPRAESLTGLADGAVDGTVHCLHGGRQIHWRVGKAGSHIG